MSRDGLLRSMPAVRQLMWGMVRSTRIDDGRVSFIQKVPPGESGKTRPLSRLRHLALRTDYWRSPGHRKVDRYANGRGRLRRHRRRPNAARWQGNHHDEPAPDFAGI